MHIICLLSWEKIQNRTEVWDTQWGRVEEGSEETVSKRAFCNRQVLWPCRGRGWVAILGMHSQNPPAMAGKLYLQKWTPEYGNRGLWTHLQGLDHEEHGWVSDQWQGLEGGLGLQVECGWLAIFCEKKANLWLNARSQGVENCKVIHKRTCRHYQAAPFLTWYGSLFVTAFSIKRRYATSAFQMH